jgi:tetratricopeptide (TPR) repeat protein
MKRLAVVVMALAFGACGISKEEAKKALDRQKTELVRMHEEKIADVQKQLEAAKAELEKVKAESAAAVAAAATSKDGDLAAATAMLLDGLPLVSSPRLKDPNLPWQYLNALGRLHLRAGKGPPAEEFFESARLRAKLAGSGAGEAKAVTNLAVARAQRGDAAAALTLLAEAMALAEQAGDRVGVLRVRFNRARVVLASSPATAMADLDAVLEQARDLGWREGEALAARAMDELKGARSPPPR